MPIIHRQATEEDIAKWPTLMIGFGKRPPSEEERPEDEQPEGEEDA